MVGIFWVIEGKLYSYSQQIESLTEEEWNRVQLTGVIDSNLSHYDCWDRELARRYPKADFATFPRGRVVFDIIEDRHIVYVDECVTNGEIAEVVKRFEIKEYQIDYDEHYTCDACIKDKGLF